MGTFQDLRAAALHAGALSIEQFAELCQFRDAGAADWSSVTAKWEQEAKPFVVSAGARPRPFARSDADATERSRVMVSRVAGWSGGPVVDTPKVGAQFKRDAAIDADVRPWTFTGEVAAFTPISQTLIVERTKRTADDRR